MAAGRLRSAVWYTAGLQGRIPALSDLAFPKLHALLKKHFVQLDLLQNLQKLWPHTALQQIVVLSWVRLQVKQQWGQVGCQRGEPMAGLIWGCITVQGTCKRIPWRSSVSSLGSFGQQNQVAHHKAAMQKRGGSTNLV